jgi:hypothetical protein
VTVAIDGVSRDSAAVNGGIDLLSMRLEKLGSGCTVVDESPAAVNLRRISSADLGEQLNETAGETPDEECLAQAYLLEARDGQVTITACSDLGLYYGLVSLVQLVHSNRKKGVVVPTLTIADWPHIARRLAKTSASSNSLEKVTDFSAWLPLMKMNQVGLQYHGNQSKDPEPPFVSSRNHVTAAAKRAVTG